MNERSVHDEEVQAFRERHVLPAWQDHDATPWCWCGPIYDDVPPNGRIWLHRAAHDDPHRYTEANDPALRRRGSPFGTIEGEA